MGVQVLDDIIDFEIRDTVKSINENFNYLQTIACCSGWSGIDTEISDGVNRKWVGNPYIMIRCLDNKKSLVNFLPTLMSILIFTPVDIKNEQEIKNYVDFLKTVDLTYNGQQIISIHLEYRNNAVLLCIHINDSNRTTDEVEKIWKLFYKALTVCKDKNF